VADLVAEGLAPTTVRKIVFVLSGIMKTAVKTRRVASNPCSDIELPTAKVKRRRYLTAREVEALAKAAGEQGTAVYVLAYCGLRWGEMAALRVRAVDLLRGRLVIDEAVTEVDGALVWGAPKDHQRRTVPVPAFLRSLLEQTIEGKSAHDLVFVTSRGAVMRVRGARRAWFDEAAAIIGGLTPHQLRYTAASLAVSAGASVLGVQRLLGHEKASMTLDVYADLFDHDWDDVATRLDEVRAAGLADLGRRDGSPSRLARPESHWYRKQSHSAPGRIRTCDTRFRRAVLYPLSYEGEAASAPHEG
jgi:integrase